MKIAPQFPLFLAPILLSLSLCSEVFANERRIEHTSVTRLAYISSPSSLQSIRQAAANSYAATQFDAALQHYKTICESGNANADDFYWLGETYLHMHRYTEAASTFDRVVELDPKADKVRVRIVQAYLGTNRSLAKEKCLSSLNLVTDPEVRQQLISLLQFCDNHTARGVQAQMLKHNVER